MSPLFIAHKPGSTHIFIAAVGLISNRNLLYLKVYKVPTVVPSLTGPTLLRPDKLSLQYSFCCLATKREGVGRSGRGMCLLQGKDFGIVLQAKRE